MNINGSYLASEMGIEKALNKVETVRENHLSSSYLSLLSMSPPLNHALNPQAKTGRPEVSQVKVNVPDLRLT